MSFAKFDSTLKRSEIPTELGKIVDIAPFGQESRSLWLLLAEDGKVFRFDAHDGKAEPAGESDVPAEVPGAPFCGRPLKRHLHASQQGEFAAVVND